MELINIDNFIHYFLLNNKQASIQWKENLLDVKKQNISSQISAMTASTAQVVTLTSDSPDNTDYNAIGAAVSSISTNLGDFSNHVMTIASINETSDIQNDRLLQAAKNLCNAFGNFLKLVEPETNEVNFFFFYIDFIRNLNSYF